MIEPLAKPGYLLKLALHDRCEFIHRRSMAHAGHKQRNTSGRGDSVRCEACKLKATGGSHWMGFT
jgi:hypothetical protein